MKNLGEIIDVDIFLLDEVSLYENNLWQENYKLHLALNKFKSFKIGIPFDCKNKLLGPVIQFIDSINLNGSYFVYFNINNEENLLALVNNYHSELTNHIFYILPDKKVKYSKLSKNFWDIQLLGFEIHILKCDKIEECRLSPSIMNKYWRKGAIVGIVGFTKNPIRLFRKRKLQQLIRQKIFDYWITEIIDQKDVTYLNEIKLKAELLNFRVLNK